MSRRHTRVRLFTFDNKPPQHLWNYFQLMVGGLIRGKGIYAVKPTNEAEDKMMRRTLRLVNGFRDDQVEDIMNFVYSKL